MKKLEVKGLDVTYVPAHVRFNPADRAVGIVTSWNDEFIFVDYGTGAQATRREDLQIGNQTWPQNNKK